MMFQEHKELKELTSQFLKTLIEAVKLLKDNPLAMMNAIFEVIFLIGGLIILLIGKFFIWGESFDNRGLYLFYLLAWAVFVWFVVNLICLFYCLRSSKVE